MNGDITRSSFDPDQRYTSVRHQQGRVVLDADLNEQRDLELADERATRIDVIGQAGVPKGDPGFEISTDGTVVEIGTGTAYVDGLRAVLTNPDGTAATAPLDFESQPEASLPVDPGWYFAVLDLWERPVNAVQDPHIREVALGGPDTATRLRLEWRVHLLPATITDPEPSCASDSPEWIALTAGSTGELQVSLDTGASSADPCDIPEDAGFRGIQNQTYRVEVHAGNADPTQAGGIDAAATPTFKWSRQDASVVATVLSGLGTTELSVDRLGPGGVTGFTAGCWVEVSDEVRASLGKPGILAEVASAEGATLTLADAAVAASLASEIDDTARPMVRLWDSGEAIPLTTGTTLPLESGVELEFSAGVYRSGDFWIIPARIAALPGTEDRQLDWPWDESLGQFVSRRADGHAHHYARLALLERTTTGWVFRDDCRDPFPPLTDIWAEDVKYDGSVCPMGGAENVQEALEHICAELKNIGGCGEIVVGPDDDLAAVLAQAGALVDTDGAWLASAVLESLAICFRPGLHTLGELRFRGFTTLRLTGLASEAARLFARVSIDGCQQVELRGLTLTDEVDSKQLDRAHHLVEVSDAAEVELQALSLSYNLPLVRIKDGQAVRIRRCGRVRMEACRVAVPLGQNGLRVQDTAELRVRDNHFRQRWDQAPSFESLPKPEQSELESWVGRLLLQLDEVSMSTSTSVPDKPFASLGPDRTGLTWRVGRQTADERWLIDVSVVGFSTSLPGALDGVQGARNRNAVVKEELKSGSQRIAKKLRALLKPGQLLTHDETLDGVSDAEFERVLTSVIQGLLAVKRRNLVGSLLARTLDGGNLIEGLMDSILASSGDWLVGLGGTAIRVATTYAAKVPSVSAWVADNTIEDFAVGVAATVQKGRVGDSALQRLDVRDNAIALRSPLVPVQRGGIIIGGARQVRVSGNTIDVAEGSSQVMDPSRGFYLGVDGITLRGALGEQVMVKENGIRGCAVGIRRTGNLVSYNDETSTPSRVVRDNSFVACDVDTDLPGGTF